MGQRGTTQQKGAGQVYVEYPLPISKLGFDYGAARIVWRGSADYGVEPAERLICCIGDGTRLALARNVTGL